jgi:integrase
VDQITGVDVADLVAALAEAGYKRETIRKTRTALSQTLDFAGVDPNPAQDERIKLPYDLEPAPALFKALVAGLPPREDRDLEAPPFPGLTDANLRMAITRASKAAAIPHFSPHALQRRRGCLHYKRTGSLAEVAELLGDTKNVAAEH